MVCKSKKYKGAWRVKRVYLGVHEELADGFVSREAAEESDRLITALWHRGFRSGEDTAMMLAVGRLGDLRRELATWSDPSGLPQDV